MGFSVGDEELPARAFNFRAVIVLSATSLVAALLTNRFDPPRSNIVGYSTFMILSSMYYISPLLQKKLTIFAFCSVYWLAHIAACFFVPAHVVPLNAILIPTALADFAAFIFVCYILYFRQA